MAHGEKPRGSRKAISLRKRCLCECFFACVGKFKLIHNWFFKSKYRFNFQCFDLFEQYHNCIVNAQLCSYENKGVKWMKSKPTLPVGLSLDQTNNSNINKNKNIQINLTDNKVLNGVSNNTTKTSTEGAREGNVELSKSVKKNMKKRMKKKMMKSQKEDEGGEEDNKDGEGGEDVVEEVDLSQLKLVDAAKEKGREPEEEEDEGE